MLYVPMNELWIPIVPTRCWCRGDRPFDNRRKELHRRLQGHPKQEFKCDENISKQLSIYRMAVEEITGLKVEKHLSI